MSPRALRLVHTSDVHVGSGVPGDPNPCGERALVAVVDAVREEAAELLLIAGDLFDHARVERATIDFVCAELARVRCPVVLIPGNHDCLDERSVYRRVDLREAGAHVHPLTAEDGETVELSELHTTVWGRGMVDHDPSYRPLAGVPERRASYWHLGLAHGLFAEPGTEGRSSPITAREIATSGLDYLALGHVHVFRDVSQHPTRACYPGSPVPVPGGSRAAGTVAVVELDPEEGVTVKSRDIALHPARP